MTILDNFYLNEKINLHAPYSKKTLLLAVSSWKAPSDFGIEQYFSYEPKSPLRIETYICRRTQHDFLNGNTKLKNVLRSPADFLMVGPVQKKVPILFQRPQRSPWSINVSQIEQVNVRVESEIIRVASTSSSGEGQTPGSLPEETVNKILPGKLDTNGYRALLFGLEQAAFETSGGLILDLRGLSSADNYNRTVDAQKMQNFLIGSSTTSFQELGRQNYAKWESAIFPLFVAGEVVGTCFAISPHLVMTCCHVLGVPTQNPNTYSFREGVFLYEHPIFLELLQYPKADAQGQFPKGLDIAIFSFPVENRFVPFSFSADWWFFTDGNSNSKQSLTVIGYEGGKSHPEQKHLSGGALSLYNFQVFHNCLTTKGFSGAPVLDKKGNLVGLHRIGYNDGSSQILATAVRIDHFLLYEFSCLFPERGQPFLSSLYYENKRLREAIGHERQ